MAAFPKENVKLTEQSAGNVRKEVVMNEIKINSPYMTAVEAAAYLRTTLHGIYSMVKRGKLRPMPGRRKLLFTREEMDASLQRRR